MAEQNKLSVKKPKLKTYLTVFPISATAWGLRGGSEEMWRITLTEPKAVQTFGYLLPFLNGEYGIEEILHQAAGRGVEREVAWQLLERLERASFLEEGEPSPLNSEHAQRFQNQIAFFARFTSEGGTRFQSRLLQSRVAVLCATPLGRCVGRQLGVTGIGEIVELHDGASAAGDLDERLQAPTGVRRLELDRDSIWPKDADGDLPEAFVVPQEAHDPLLLEAMDTFSKKHKIPWLLLRAVDPHEGWVGPLFIPGETASYASLEARLRANMRYFDDYLAFDGHVRSSGRPAATCGGLSAFFEVLAGVAVVELVKYLSGLSVPHLAGRFLTIRLTDWETEIHDVLKIPHLETELATPRIFPWKEIPYDEQKTRRG